MLTWPHHLLFFVLLVAVPLWDRYETRALKHPRTPRAKVHSYARTVGFLWIAALFAFLTTSPRLLFRPQGMEAVRTLLPSSGAAAGVIFGVLVGLLAGAAAPVIMARRSPELRQKVLARFEPLAFFLPRTAEERRWFAVVSISAGVCEEVIYRGFLISYLYALLPGVGVVGSILLAAIVFGLAHGYQGVVGVLTTAVLALVFSALFYIVGGLWLAMLLHALIDLRILIMLPRNWKPRGA